MAKRITASFEIEVHAPVGEVWRVLAEDFAAIGDWSSGVKSSTGSGPSVNGSQCSERACEIAAAGFSDTRERILEYSPKELIRYELYDGLPGFVTKATNSWYFRDSDGRTHIKGQTDMQVKGLAGTLMSGLMRKNLTRVLGEMATEAKHFIETGTVHPKKLKLIKKLSRRRRKM